MLMDAVSSRMRVAIPGVIQSFNSTEQTVTVQPAVQELVTHQNLSQSNVSLPLLVDIPIVFPRAGGFVLTMPVQTGDECLVVFGDMAIDGWWQNGGTKNPQPDIRRHDLSDGFAVLGTWSQPNVVPNYSTTSAQLRTDDGSVYIDLSKSGISLVAPVNTITANGKVLG